MILSKQDCPECQGEGFLFYLEPAGVFSDLSEAFEPQEGYIECDVCAGEGVIDVCSYCQELPTIRNGREVCGCEVLELPKAA